MRFLRNRSDTEADEVCGAGFLAEGNTFENNAAVVHSSNGGAISLECEFVDVV